MAADSFALDELIQNVDHQLNLCWEPTTSRSDWFGGMHEDTSLIRNGRFECPLLADFNEGDSI